MRAVDRAAIKDYGMPAAALMENAGRALAEAYLAFFPRGAVAVFCGGGNNGGDGLVAARHLANAGLAPRVVLLKRPEDFRGEALEQWRPVRRMGLPWTVFQGPEKLLRFLRRPRGAIDAVLGTGTRAPLREDAAALLAALNALRAPALAADVPSGLDADKGVPLHRDAVRARRTVAMGLPKRGLVAARARRWVGRLHVADIGLPAPLLKKFLK
jgi:ADP-dependent NAD(P)H-hydrate dehydratase / NAD(P)H-hydrate epimerase